MKKVFALSIAVLVLFSLASVGFATYEDVLPEDILSSDTSSVDDIVSPLAVSSSDFFHSLLYKNIYFICVTSSDGYNFNFSRVTDYGNLLRSSNGWSANHSINGLCHISFGFVAPVSGYYSLSYSNLTCSYSNPENKPSTFVKGSYTSSWFSPHIFINGLLYATTPDIASYPNYDNTYTIYLNTGDVVSLGRGDISSSSPYFSLLAYNAPGSIVWDGHLTFEFLGVHPTDSKYDSYLRTFEESLTWLKNTFVAVTGVSSLLANQFYPALKNIDSSVGGVTSAVGGVTSAVGQVSSNVAAVSDAVKTSNNKLEDLKQAAENIEDAVKKKSAMEQFEEDYLKAQESQLDTVTEMLSPDNPALPNNGNVAGFSKDLSKSLGIKGSDFSFSEFNKALDMIGDTKSDSSMWSFFSQDTADSMATPNNKTRSISSDDNWLDDYISEAEKRRSLW